MVTRAFALIRIVPVAAVVLFGSSIGPVGAAPGDRPSPPGDVAAYHCSKQEKTPPKICVTFKNTATEPVGFWFEWTRNGEKLPSTLAGYDVGCVTGSLYGCEALNWFGGPSGYAPKVRYNTDREWAFGFTLQNLDYDTEFCFRFKAVNKDGLVSENWTRWVCANTGPVPVIPAAPKPPVVTLIPGTSGRRTPGEGTPPKLLVEWERVLPDTAGIPDNVGWYDIEREGNLGTGSVTGTPTRHEADKPLEVTLTLGNDPYNRVTSDSEFRVRVCAANPVMRKCSAWGRTPTVTSTLADARDGTTRTTLPSPGTGRFEPGAPTSRAGADDTAGRTLGKRRRPGAGNETSAAAGVNPAIYDLYAGRYQASAAHVITITREGDRLKANQLDPSQPGLQHELLPESAAKFATNPSGIVVWFAKNPDGTVRSIKIVYPNREVFAMRMPN